MDEPPVRYIRDWIKGGQDATLVLVTAVTNAARAPRARSHAHAAVAVTSRILARMAVTAGLAVVGWLLTLAFSSSASAAEAGSDDGGGGLLGGVGGVVGGLADTTSNLADTTLKTVKSTTDTVTKTVQSTVKTVTDTVKTTTGVVDDTLDNVTGTVGDTVDTVDTVTPEVPATQPVEAAPAETSPAPAVSKPAAKAVTKKASADRPKPSARAVVRTDLARPDESPTRVADVPRAAGSSSAASNGSDSGPFGSKLPSAPCGTASSAAVAADSAGKKLSGLAADSATISHPQRTATGSAQPAAATVAAASLPCTSPD